MIANIKATLSEYIWTWDIYRNMVRRGTELFTEAKVGQEEQRLHSLRAASRPLNRRTVAHRPLASNHHRHAHSSSADTLPMLGFLGL